MPGIRNVDECKRLEALYLRQFMTRYVEVRSLIIITCRCQWDEVVNVQDHDNETSQVE